VQCFRKAFLIITAATVAAVLVSLVLVWRTRNFYKGDIYAKFRDNAAAADDDEEEEDGPKRPKKEAEGESTSVNGRKG